MYKVRRDLRACSSGNSEMLCWHLFHPGDYKISLGSEKKKSLKTHQPNSVPIFYTKGN